MNRSIKDVILSDLAALRLLIGTLACILGAGLIFADTNGGAYHYLKSLGPEIMWGALFIGYGLLRAVSATDECPMALTILLSSMGVCLWLLVVASFMQNPVRPVGSADLSATALAVCEVWIAINRFVAGDHGRV